MKANEVRMRWHDRWSTVYAEDVAGWLTSVYLVSCYTLRFDEAGLVLVQGDEEAVTYTIRLKTIWVTSRT